MFHRERANSNKVGILGWGDDVFFYSVCCRGDFVSYRFMLNINRYTLRLDRKWNWNWDIVSIQYWFLQC